MQGLFPRALLSNIERLAAAALALAVGIIEHELGPHLAEKRVKSGMEKSGMDPAERGAK